MDVWNERKIVKHLTRHLSYYLYLFELLMRYSQYININLTVWKASEAPLFDAVLL